MPQNQKYQQRPCAYCGANTGRNQREHVVPKCVYASRATIPGGPLTVPTCPTCNHRFSKHEAHFRNVVAACGPSPSAPRHELIEKTMRSFRNPKSGRGDLQRLWRQITDSAVPKPDGTPYKQVMPHMDEDVRFIARKVVRGLVHSLDRHTVIPDNRVIVREYIDPPEEITDVIEPGYCVPGQFSSHYVLIDERFADEFRRDMHSYWQIKFFDLELTCLVVQKALPPLDADG